MLIKIGFIDERATVLKRAFEESLFKSIVHIERLYVTLFKQRYWVYGNQPNKIG